MADALLFSFALVDCLFLLFVTVYFWVPVDIVAQTLLTGSLLFINFHWFLFLLNVPITAWGIYQFVSKPSGNLGIYDAAEIHNRHTLKGHMKVTMIKLGYHLVFFFVYLYSMIVSLLS